ncbi:hypothetical protein QQ045_020308 [Rhodiola kirilowii]
MMIWLIFLPLKGDPLTPYLVLRVAFNAFGEGGILWENKRGEIGQGVPVISHLFFADNSIFFMKATKENADNLLAAVLKEYEMISGQRINFAKSEINFSKNVPVQGRETIAELFGVQQVESHTRYLELPIIFSHNKTEVFRFIVESTWKKVLGWKQSHLSSAGKEIMIKSVLQAPMMCFKLPDIVCVKDCQV